jgi:hypothetical protein
MRKLGYLGASALLLVAAWSLPAAAGEYGRRHHHHGVDVTYGTPGFALPDECCNASVVEGPGLPSVVYGPPIYQEPVYYQPIYYGDPIYYLVDQVPTGTYPLGQFRDPALFHSPYEFPYVSAYGPYYPRYRKRAHRRVHYK